MVQKLIADWATVHPRIRRAWIAGADPWGCELISLEVEPVPDSGETFAVWMANCRRWHGELEARLGRQVRLSWVDLDVMTGVEGSELVYDCADFSRPRVQ